jgi:hypothetical protein
MCLRTALTTSCIVDPASQDKAAEPYSPSRPQSQAAVGYGGLDSFEHIPWQVETTVAPAREIMHPQDSRHWERAVDVRKELGPTFKIFIDHVCDQRRPVDFEKDKVRLPPTIEIGHSRELMSIGAVDETIGAEGFRYVVAQARSFICLSPGRDVENGLHT